MLLHEELKLLSWLTLNYIYLLEDIITSLFLKYSIVALSCFVSNREGITTSLDTNIPLYKAFVVSSSSSGGRSMSGRRGRRGRRDWILSIQL